MPSRKGHTLRPTLLLVSLIVFLFSHPAEASILDTIVGQISQADYQAYVETLEDFGTRYYNRTGNTNAQNYLFQELSALGLDVALDDFYYNGTQYNVVATLPGVTTPEEIYIVGAHYDCMPNSSTAPGADDNASGVAAVLEIANVLSNYHFASTIKFVLFDAEEQGLKGSWAYAADAASNGEDIRAMLNFDMIAYTGGNEDEDVEVYGEEWLREVMIESIATYTSLPYEAHAPLTYGSDHVPFSSTNYAGSSSLLLIEDSPEEIWGGSNPYYHKTTDTSDHLDWEFAAGITVAGAATIARLAQVTTVPYLALDFGPLGLYLYSGSTWTRLSKLNPEDMLEVDGVLYSDFGGVSKGGLGLYKYNGTWKRISIKDAEGMWAAGSDLYVQFESLGLYRYDGTAFERVATWTAEDVIEVGGVLYVDFGGADTGGRGLYKYEGDVWTRIDRNDAEGMVAIGTDLFVDFGGVATGGFGLYKYDGSWKRINTKDAEGMCAVGTDLYVDFGEEGYGLYKYDGTWDRISTRDAEGMVVVGTDLYVDFGGVATGGYGLYKYDGTWKRMNTKDAQGICGVGTDLYVDFGEEGFGLYKYDGTWDRISTRDAEGMWGVNLY